MSENRAILEKTFALTSQQQEGTIALLDVTVEGQILVEGNLTELEEAPNVVGSSAQTEEEAEIPIAYVRQEIVDLGESNDEEDEDEEADSDATEENPHLAAEDHPSEDSQDRAWPDSPPPPPPPYSPEATSSRRRRSPLDQRGKLRSPSPPGYVPSYYLQNMEEKKAEKNQIPLGGLDGVLEKPSGLEGKNVMAAKTLISPALAASGQQSVMVYHRIIFVTRSAAAYYGMTHPSRLGERTPDQMDYFCSKFSVETRKRWIEEHSKIYEDYVVEMDEFRRSLSPAERTSFRAFRNNRAGVLEDGDTNSKSTSASLKSLEDFLKTKLFYEKKKLNLLQEGYAKLTAELNQGIDDTVTPLCIEQHGVIHLEDIYCWLTPKDSEIDESAAKELADAKEYARRMNAVPKEDDKIKELIEERAPYNQKFELCEALLSVGAWDQASILLEFHPDFFVTSYLPISSSICNLVDNVIELVYRTRCCTSPEPSDKPVLPVGVCNPPKTAKEMKELRETAFPMLLSLGPHLYNYPVLPHKLIGLCNTALDDCGLNSSKELPKDLDSLYINVRTLFDVVILPSLALLESNSSVAEEIWNVLKKLPCEHRHQLQSIEASEEMTKEHMEAMQGGELLRAEVAHFGQVRVTKKVAQRLKETLLESNLAIPLCDLIAQQRGKSRQCPENRELDGKLYDQCQVTLVQLGTFSALNMSDDDHVRCRPQLESWLSDCHNHADVAFFLARPMFAHAINSKYDELRRAEKNLLPDQNTQKYLESVRLVMTPISRSVRPLFAAQVWEHLSPQFFATFWSLTVYDLSVPNAAYEREVQRLEEAIQQKDENRDLPDSKRKKELDRCTALMDKLLAEEKKQKDHNERIMARLAQEKDSWFLKSSQMETIIQFLRHTAFFLAAFSSRQMPYFALALCRYVRLMHNLKTPNFSTLNCYDCIFLDITKTVTSCTENEANCYGRFLCAMLETEMHWHSSKKIFDEECANYPGFVIKFCVGEQPPEKNDHVDFENYRHAVHKWHYKIAKALVVCLESKDYVQIRNALIVLIRILPFFPVITPLVGFIDRNVEVVRSEQRDKRQDLSEMAISYSGQLKNKKTSIPEHEFHLVTRKPVTKTAPRDREDHKERRFIKPRRNLVKGKASVKGELDVSFCSKVTDVGLASLCVSVDHLGNKNEFLCLCKSIVKQWTNRTQVTNSGIQVAIENLPELEYCDMASIQISAEMHQRDFRSKEQLEIPKYSFVDLKLKKKYSSPYTCGSLKMVLSLCPSLLKVHITTIAGLRNADLLSLISVERLCEQNTGVCGYFFELTTPRVPWCTRNQEINQTSST
ncbi:hypothetical protein DAPPUDRAFT_229018 [Daphnia pulex]|uniref:THO complex subunitTHOC2 C-terminal domain-containing protein n=1 Tax=Daphnia pulex TaxID=6669 RepID=E9HJI6_DAPPU|nr:hypothetical protein DAPPUDRAFT_229018 [Daphnia pulex]|eukprot:EFX68099.1 hypothetical protein DAPPUDRAFT_229018 [Daphnia pulex]